MTILIAMRALPGGEHPKLHEVKKSVSKSDRSEALIEANSICAATRNNEWNTVALTLLVSRSNYPALHSVANWSNVSEVSNEPT